MVRNILQTYIQIVCNYSIFMSIIFVLNVISSGQVFYSGISFGIFETLKDMLCQSGNSSQHEVSFTTINNYQRFGCGAIAGLVAQSSTYPLDVIRLKDVKLTLTFPY